MQTLEDIEDVAETLQDDETNAWTEYDEEDIETVEEEDTETQPEDESEAVKEEVESEIIDEIDILADFRKEFEAKRTKELAVKAEETKKQLLDLIRVT